MAETTLERPLPQNTDAERSVLGAILLDNHTLNTAIEKLKPEDFFDDRHRRIFNHMIQLGEAQQAIDLVTLTDQLRRKGELEATGGAAYVAQLVEGVPRVSNLDHYARIIKEKSLLRSLIYASHTIQQSALDAEDDADALLDRAESSIFQIAEDRIRTGLVSVKEVVHDNMGRLERDIMENGARRAYDGYVQQQLDVRSAAFGIDHSCRKAFGGKNCIRSEHSGECRPASARLNCHFQLGDVQGIVADAPAGFAGTRRRAQISHRTSETRGLERDDAGPGSVIGLAPMD
jgi:hypothetical protein